MTKSRLRRIHVTLAAPQELTTGGRRVVFSGANLLTGVVMIEYDVDPPLRPATPFGPHIVVLRVTDDADGELYPTAWEDFVWTNMSPGRMTTRLERRPPAAATKLIVDVHALPPTQREPDPTRAGSRLGSFQIPLPAGHGDAIPTHQG